MGFRIRKSIKVGKGMRVNLGKSGVGMSFGTRGLRHTMHSSGRRTDSVGLPGTGLYYTKSRTKTSGSPANTSEPTSPKKQAQLKKNQSVVDAYHEYIHTITQLHRQSTPPIDWEAIYSLEAPYHPETIGPNEQRAKEEYEQFSPNIIQRLIKLLAANKRKQLKQQIKTAREKDHTIYREWETQHQLAERVLQKEPAAFQDVIVQKDAFHDVSEWINRSQFSMNENQVPEITFTLKTKDVIPEKSLSLTKTGRVSRRKMTKTDYYKIKQDYVTSFAIYAARQVMAILPTDDVIIHMLENRLNTVTGHQKEVVILSVSLKRQTMEMLDFERIDPSDAMENFDHRMKHLKTKGFRQVKRFIS